jgi:multimeric flavodoxin WrbA
MSLICPALSLNLIIPLPLPQAFWDATGGLWLKGALAGKFAGIFVSTGTPGGGQETTVISSMSTLVHHGMIFVPLGYKDTFPQLSNVNEVRGGMYPPFAFVIAGYLFLRLLLIRFSVGCWHLRWC